MLRKLRQRLRRQREQSRLTRLLESRHPRQAAGFDAATEGFAETYARLSRRPIDPYVTPAWRQFNSELETALLPRPSRRFLETALIRKTMFVRTGGEWMAAQAELVRGQVGDADFPAFIAEDAAGGPEIHDAELLTSHNRLHHASHLVAFEQKTGAQASEFGSVVEWGGGYGGFARLFLRRHGGAPTYVIVDTPLFTCLQRAYLASVLGSEQVCIWEDPSTPPAPGKVNLLPLGHVTGCAETLRCDLFVSTWALSESAVAAQDLVTEKAWFGAKHLLLAFQDSSSMFPSAGRVGELAASVGATLKPVPYLPGNTYAFR